MSIETHLQKGGELFDSDPKAALAAYYQVVTLEPSHIEGWNQIGRLMFDLEQYSEAAMVFTRVEKLANEQGLPDWAEMAAQNIELTNQTLQQINDEMSDDSLEEVSPENEAVYENELTIEPVLDEEDNSVVDIEPEQVAPSDEEAKSISDIGHIAAVALPPVASSAESVAVASVAQDIKTGNADAEKNLLQSQEAQDAPPGIEVSSEEVASEQSTTLQPVEVDSIPIEGALADVREVATPPVAQMSVAATSVAQNATAQDVESTFETAQPTSAAPAQDMAWPPQPVSAMPVAPNTVNATQDNISSADTHEYQPAPVPPAFNAAGQVNQARQPFQPAQSGQVQPFPPTTQFPATSPGASSPPVAFNKETVGQPSMVPPTVDREMDAPKSSSSGKIALMISGVVGAAGIGIGAAQYLNSGHMSSSHVPVIKSEVKLAKKAVDSVPEPVAVAVTVPKTPTIPSPEDTDKDGAYKIGATYLVNKEYDKARSYLERAAALGHAEAAFNLALLYVKGDGVGQNFSTAVEYFKKSADGGYYPAMTNLGLLYAQGQGVEQDYMKARALWLKAAAGEHPDAMHNLAVIYATGKGVKKDMGEAIKWYRKAANGNYVDSIFDLGLLYANGDGIERDYAEAKRLWEIAAAKGHKLAATNLEKLKRVMARK